MTVTEAKHRVKTKYPNASVYSFDPSAWHSNPYYDMVWIEDGNGNEISGHFFHADSAWIDAFERLI
jgi:hypothetical protein